MKKAPKMEMPAQAEQPTAAATTATTVMSTRIEQVLFKEAAQW
jgi:hypothetical protein